jgi:hypothetical protein
MDAKHNVTALQKAILILQLFYSCSIKILTKLFQFKSSHLSRKASIRTFLVEGVTERRDFTRGDLILEKCFRACSLNPPSS